MAENIDANAAAEFRSEEERVEAHARVFHKELGLRDLVLTQILFIVGLSWVGTAAKLGPSHVVFWLLAILLFYIPSAIVVIYLNGLMPLEGGLYQWAKLGFNDFLGFMVAWNLWLFVILNTSELGLQTTTYLSYAIGPKAAWLAETKWLIALASITLVGALVLISIRGLSLGKWVHNTGGIIMLVIFVTLLGLPLLNLARGTLTEYHPLKTAMPVFNKNTLNLLGKMGFGALGGFEYVAILAGESRNPSRTIGRSVMIAAPIIAVMFILGTSSILAFVPPENVDLIGPIPQVLSLGFSSFGFVAYLAAISISLMLILRLTQASFTFTSVTRLPMVAGWDRLLPEWFTRLHARHKTPINSIIVVGAITLCMGLLSLIGVGQQEAFQLLWNAGGIFYALTYLVMFAISLVGLRSAGVRVPLWLRLTSLSGFLMTLLYASLSVFPIISVANSASFTAKIIAVIVIANIIGAGIFLLAERRRAASGRETASTPAD